MQFLCKLKYAKHKSTEIQHENSCILNFFLKEAYNFQTMKKYTQTLR